MKVKESFFFGGAGVSTESGIPDFRSANGVYNLKLDRNFSPEELVSHTMYEKYPEERILRLLQKTSCLSRSKTQLCP